MNVVTRGYGRRSGMASSFGYGRRIVDSLFFPIVEWVVCVLRRKEFTVGR